jgi:mRNA interferase MazF
MASYKFGDVVLVDFPFSNRNAEKRRPGLVLAQDSHGDLLVIRISSKTAELPTDVTLTNWHAAGLNIPSTTRLLKMTTMHESTVLKTLGKVTKTDREAILKALESFLASLKMAE